ncbi:MAG: DnaD domain protein [Lachnospiraceae bacterium]|nr:DnaD domain protein [Lachnospiraceae bacterium]
MSSLNIYKEQLSEYTTISNYFIDHYMEDANEAQLQVYLYLLRMISANLPVSVADIVAKFKHSEKEVLRALKYWELQKLLTLELDSDKNLTGIYFHSIPVPATETIHIASATPIADKMSIPMEKSSATVVTPFSLVAPVLEEKSEPVSKYAKPTYTADQLRRFKDQENTAQLLYVAQAYVGKPLSVADVKTIYYMCDVLHFSDDLIDYLIQYCVERGKKDFRYMEKVAINWAEEGITTPKQAEKATSKYDKSVYTIMNALGKTGTPTTKELEFIRRWTNEYGFTNDIILEACDRTVLATDKHRFEYTEGILNSWKRDGVHHKSDITKLDNHYQQKQKQTATKPATANRFNQFTQNTYDFAELEKELLSN